MFDGSSIEGFVRIEESDMYLRPDLATFRVFPWPGTTGETIARIICDIYTPDGQPFIGDSAVLPQESDRDGPRRKATR